MKGSLFFPRWIILIDEIKKGKNQNRISRDTGITFNYISLVIKELQKIDIVCSEKVGRTNQHTFTKVGEQVADACSKLRGLMQNG